MSTSIAHDTDTALNQRVAEQLNTAAEHIERHGLHKVDFYGLAGPDGCACVLGAIANACGCDAECVDYQPAAIAFLEYLVLNVPGLALIYHPGFPDDGADMALALAGVNLIETVGGWNDAPERTAEQVAATLRAAARWAGEQR